MSASTETTKTEELSLARTVGGLARHYLGGRRGLLLVGGAAVLAGIVFNWSWFVAVGLAPLLLAIAPCAAMCALGLCMNKMMGSKSCSTQANSGAEPAETGSSSPVVSAKVDNEPVVSGDAPQNKQ
ncbi:MAG: hypothetical protein ACT4PS_01250 [Betaproteobacteria bacterium]